MFATMKYGIGEEVTVPLSRDTIADLSEQSVQDALQVLLGRVQKDPDGTAPVLREALQDVRSVIEVKTARGYEPIVNQAPFREMLQGQDRLEVMVSRPHAGG